MLSAKPVLYHTEQPSNTDPSLSSHGTTRDTASMNRDKRREEKTGGCRASVVPVVCGLCECRGGKGAWRADKNAKAPDYLVRPQHGKATSDGAERSHAHPVDSNSTTLHTFFGIRLCRHPEVEYTVVVGFARNDDGHNHRQGNTFARADL